MTATLGILVRFISNLTSGDLLCIVNDMTANSTGLQIRHSPWHPTLPQINLHHRNQLTHFLHSIIFTMSPTPSSISGPFHISLSAYAAQEPGCKDKVRNPMLHDAA